MTTSTTTCRPVHVVVDIDVAISLTMTVITPFRSRLLPLYSEPVSTSVHAIYFFFFALSRYACYASKGVRDDGLVRFCHVRHLFGSDPVLEALSCKSASAPTRAESPASHSLYGFPPCFFFLIYFLLFLFFVFVQIFPVLFSLRYDHVTDAITTVGTVNMPCSDDATSRWQHIRGKPNEKQHQ